MQLELYGEEGEGGGAGDGGGVLRTTAGKVQSVEAELQRLTAQLEEARSGSGALAEALRQSLLQSMQGAIEAQAREMMGAMLEEQRARERESEAMQVGDLTHAGILDPPTPPPPPPPRARTPASHGAPRGDSQSRRLGRPASTAWYGCGAVRWGAASRPSWFQARIEEEAATIREEAEARRRRQRDAQLAQQRREAQGLRSKKERLLEAWLSVETWVVEVGGGGSKKQTVRMACVVLLSTYVVCMPGAGGAGGVLLLLLLLPPPRTAAGCCYCCCMPSASD